MYYLDLASLGVHGFSLQDLSSGQPSQAILNFLGDCLDPKQR
jgi:hypothetical protein